MNVLKTVIFILIMVASLSDGVFFHEPSLIPIHPYQQINHSDFGFAMGFQSSRHNLVVGAPTVDLYGKVYNCNMNNVSDSKEVNCEEHYVNTTVAFGKPSKDKNVRNQHLLLGSTIAATSEYFFSCAPLWSTSICGSTNPFYETFGRCYKFDQYNNTSKYSGTYAQYCKYRTQINNGELFYGGTGGSTLVDEVNGLLLIVKTSLEGDIVYTHIDKPTANTESMVLYGKRGIKFKVDDFYNLGFGITAGKFFSNQTVYAFSLMTKHMEGVVEFIKYNPKTKTLSVINDDIDNGKYTIYDASVGTMFGSVLAAADLNLDGYDELLVGAPAKTEDVCIECGALYIYLGGNLATLDERQRFYIKGIKDFSRFGSAIAAKDIDGDKIPDLAVSAPYEDGGLGAVYILSGYELARKLNTSETVMSLSDLKYTQRIQKEGYKSLGYSLQFISDVDGNGCNELVAGSPGSGAAVLLKSIQVVTITLSITLIGEQIVKEQDLNFTIEVCAIVEYPKPPNNIFANITIVNSVIGDASYIRSPRKDFNISCTDCPRKKLFCQEFMVELKDQEPRLYKFISEAKLHTEHIFNSAEYNNSWVVASPYSQMKNARDVSRHCSGNDCIPNLSMNLLWSGSKDIRYALGSSASETVTIQVRNDGNSSYEACVWMRVRGAPLSEIGCQQIDSEYRCDVMKPLKRGAEQLIDLRLNMMRLTNWDTELLVEARLYENCYKADSTDQNITIQYDLTADEVFVEGISHTRNITLKEVEDVGQEISDYQEYHIMNNGSVTWKKIVANITMKKKPYINRFKVSADCKELDTDDEYKVSCYLNLKPNSTQKIIVTTEILKLEMKKHLVHNALETSSQLELLLLPTDNTKIGQATSILTLERKKVGNNKWLIALIAGIIATVILIIITVVLYKYGFFKRKQKQRLRVFRESVRQRSTRRNTHVSSVTEGLGLVDVDYDEDSAFEDVTQHTTHKNMNAIDENAELHCSE